jgi:hypothetical protein
MKISEMNFRQPVKLFSFAKESMKDEVRSGEADPPDAFSLHFY